VKLPLCKKPSSWQMTSFARLAFFKLHVLLVWN
jgi:hypothetical protein